MQIININGKDYIESYEKFVSEVKLSVPEELDIFNNTEETLQFFWGMLRITGCVNFKGIFILDFKNVKKLSIDAIMYMLVLVIKNKNSNIEFAVTKPKNSKCKRLFLKCGIGKFLQHKGDFKEDFNDYFSIVFGNTVDVEKAKSMSDFCHSKLGVKSNEFKFIYKIFIELMNNTVQHAYIAEKAKSQKMWFVFIEDTESRLKFTFLDTGVGIPSTVQKHEDWSELWNTQNDLKNLIEGNDSRFIFSALSGDVRRSATGDLNRGRGLPEIYGYFKNDKFTSNLKIISGKGICKFYDSQREVPILNDLDSNLLGTLFYWEIDKKYLNQLVEIKKGDL